ncbi:GntR family transcriptional regulator [Streptomyces endophyticus]|uniref:GntR family transcriptional regulator n=1 Tax=Streptomyces endophyticus TaxID=714166 RepID=A0ABU6F242_9ACTN|nr:GntR family transcriptional regulator [Streptomyces endophyticus]MEB8338076.1 GntR family transcriptional regulator [Streptomyces endophyticus]
MDAALYAAMSTPSPQPSSPRRSGRNLREETYAELRRMLLMGRFGVRTRLVEVQLAEQLAVSRTPVREALVRLLADGLVERHPDGYYAARPNLAELRDLYELRITVELRGIARALESGSVVHNVQVLEPLREHWRALRADMPEPDPGFVLEDEAFHHALLHSSGNSRLTETLTSVTTRIRPVRMYDYLTEDRIERTVTEHLQIVEHVLARRLPEALTTLRKHIGESLDVIEERAAHALAQMALRGD